MKTITLKEVEVLKAQNRAIYVYPRKKIVCVGGSKYYKLINETKKGEQNG